MVNHRRRFSPIVLLHLALIGCLVSCVMSTPIKKIIDNPRDYAGKTVTIAGEVGDVFSLVVLKYFVVKDATGEITVITKKPLPKQGTRIKVTGTVQEAFSIGDQQLIVIVEGDGEK